jgi:polyisoprenoid-binding protein YceI
MKNKVNILTFLMMAILPACHHSPNNQKSEITKSAYLDTNGADTLIASHHASQITWKGFKPGGEHTGMVNLKPDGIILIKGNQLVGLDIAIDLTSIADSDLTDPKMNEMLIKHLKSPDFFNVDSFPTAHFVLSGLSKTVNNGPFAYMLSGNMTIKNITRPISFKANIDIKENSFSAESEPFMLNRTQWNVNYGSKSIFKELTDKFINDEFSVQILLKSMQPISMQTL